LEAIYRLTPTSTVAHHLLLPRRHRRRLQLPPGHQPADEEEEDEKDDKEEDVHLSEVHMERLHKAGQQGAATVFTTAAGQAVAAIEHSMATPLRSVGLQVWRGALLLADYLLHRGAAALDGITALELGAGPGLTGLVLAQLAAGGRIFLTGAPPHYRNTLLAVSICCMCQ
jgi:hypothetical protein